MAGRLQKARPATVSDSRGDLQPMDAQGANDGAGDRMDGAAADLPPPPPPGRRLRPDKHEQHVGDRSADTPATAHAALEPDPMEELVPVLRKLGALLEGPRHASLRQALAEWVLQVTEGRGLASAQPDLAEDLLQLRAIGGLDAMGALLAARIDAFPQPVRKPGRERALEPERALLVRQTRCKFDGVTAQRIVALLDDIEDPERLAEIGEAVVDCALGTELLDRVGLDGDRS